PFGPGRRYLHSGIAGKVIGGWELSGIFTASTGRPIDITVSRSSSDVPFGYARNQRPNLVPGIPIYPANQSIDNWLNPAAFAEPRCCRNGHATALAAYVAPGFLITPRPNQGPKRKVALPPKVFQCFLPGPKFDT